jgi:hypothetical protein
MFLINNSESEIVTRAQGMDFPIPAGATIEINDLEMARHVFALWESAGLAPSGGILTEAGHIAAAEDAVAALVHSLDSLIVEFGYGELLPLYNSIQEHVRNGIPAVLSPTLPRYAITLA